MKKDTTDIYESTVYPGATEEICLPILEQYSSMKCNVDFKLAYSPERVTPGDKEHSLENVVKIVSDSDKDTLEDVANLYNKIVKKGVYKVSSIKVAEATKILENVQRDVNIALMNELTQVYKKLDIDINEVIDAAMTK